MPKICHTGVEYTGVNGKIISGLLMPSKYLFAIFLLSSLILSRYGSFAAKNAACNSSRRELFPCII